MSRFSFIIHSVFSFSNFIYIYIYVYIGWGETADGALPIIGYKLQEAGTCMMDPLREFSTLLNYKLGRATVFIL